MTEAGRRRGGDARVDRLHNLLLGPRNEFASKLALERTSVDWICEAPGQAVPRISGLHSATQIKGAAELVHIREQVSDRPLGVYSNDDVVRKRSGNLSLATRHPPASRTTPFEFIHINISAASLGARLCNGRLTADRRCWGSVNGPLG